MSSQTHLQDPALRLKFQLKAKDLYMEVVLVKVWLRPLLTHHCLAYISIWRWSIELSELCFKEKGPLLVPDAWLAYT